MKDDLHYWFPAKRYGWGWGTPSTWQGWLVLAVWAAIVGAAGIAFGAPESGLFAIVTVLATLALLAVCLVKGEPLSWRWGDHD